MAFAAARMILKDKRRKSKEEYVPPTRTRSKVINLMKMFILYRMVDCRHPLLQRIKSIDEIRSNVIYQIKSR